MLFACQPVARATLNEVKPRNGPPRSKRFARGCSAPGKSGAVAATPERDEDARRTHLRVRSGANERTSALDPFPHLAVGSHVRLDLGEGGRRSFVVDRADAPANR